MTTAQILHYRVEELTTEGKSAEGFELEAESATGEEWRVPLSFRVCGILPWSGSAFPLLSTLYQCVAVAVTASGLAGVLLEMALVPSGFGSAREAGCVAHGRVCWQQKPLLSELPLAVGALCGGALLGRFGRSSILADTLRLLHVHAGQSEVLGRWERRASRDAGLLLLLWLCALAPHCAGVLSEATGGGAGLDTHSAVHLAVFAAVSAILMCLTFCLMYVCRALNVMVDVFCCRVVEQPDLDDAVHKWNVLQAILRKAGMAIDLSFIALQAVAAFTVPLVIADFLLLGASYESLPALAPAVLLTCGVVRLFFLAASITEKCARVPPLLNSLSFGQGTARMKQHIVEHIANSAAGFYVFDIRLTTGMGLKFMYGWCVIAFGLGTNLLTRGGGGQ